jgi:Lrp/AsnC family leucine-responsive transcriptional regulator
MRVCFDTGGFRTSHAIFLAEGILIGGKANASQVIRTVPGAIMVELDSIDRKILNLLQKNNRLTNLELSERVRLSPPTCLKRVRRLREAKVIAADVALLDPKRVSNSLFVIIEVVLDRQGEKLQQEFERNMARTNEVMQCYMVSGHADFVVVVQISDMDAYHTFVRRTFTDDPNIRNFRSLFAMNRTKFQTEIDLGAG